MKKSLLALALLGAFAGVAQAQSSVVIYGNLDVGVIKRTNEPLTIGKRNNNTLGFKGTEDLGNGLKAIFQLEMRYEPDTGTNETGAGGVQRPLFQGQSRVGLTGDFGMVRIGRGLTALQESTIAFEPFNGIVSPAGFYTDLAVAGYVSDPLGLPSNSGNRFSNAVWYNSPVFAGGFQINTTIASKEANGNAAIVGVRTPALPQFPANTGPTSHPYSISTTYKNAGAGVMLGMERNGIESELMSFGGYIMPLPTTKLMVTITRQDQEYSRVTNQNTKAWVLGANHTMGASRFLAGYGQKNVDGLAKVKQFSLGYEYSLSKRTTVYADLSNKKGVPVAAPNFRSSINHYAVGVNHAF